MNNGKSGRATPEGEPLEGEGQFIPVWVLFGEFYPDPGLQCPDMYRSAEYLLLQGQDARVVQACPLEDSLLERVQQDVRRGMHEEPELVGEEAVAGASVGGEVNLHLFYV